MDSLESAVCEVKIKTIAAIILKNTEQWFYQFTRQHEKIIPYKALIQITNDCNSRCTSCHIWTINKNQPELKNSELVTADWEIFFKSFNKHLLWLSLSGGEVTLQDNWNEFFTLARTYCPNLKVVTFTTNGLRPEAALALALLIETYGYDQFVTVSLDGDEELHDKIRGVKGNFNLATTTQALLKKNNIPVYFGITLNNANHEFVKNSYHEYRKDMKAVSFLHSEGIYATKNHADDELIQASLVHIRKHFSLNKISEIIEWIYLRLGEKFLAEKRSKNIIPCDVLSSSVHVLPNGDLHPCMFLKKISNVKENNFFQSITSPETIELRRKIQKGECPKCWMNCYTPHSIMKHPVESLVRALWPM